MERQKQIKRMKSRDASRLKFVEETDKSSEEGDKEKRIKGKSWRNRLQIFVVVLSPVNAITARIILPLVGMSI